MTLSVEQAIASVKHLESSIDNLLYQWWQRQYLVCVSVKERDLARLRIQA